METMTRLLLNGPDVVKISAGGEDFFVRRDLFWAAEGGLLADLLFENDSVAEIRSGEIELSCGSHAFTNLLHYWVVHSRSLYSEVDFFRGPIIHNGYAIVSDGQVKLPPANDMSKLLGQGAFGKVKRAEALWLRGQEVAVKLVENERYAYDEAAYLSKLRHPNIVILHAVCTGERFGLVLELVDGANLTKLLYDVDGCCVYAQLGAAIKIAEALAFMHASGIMHRDLKPSNVLLGNCDVIGYVPIKFWVDYLSSAPVIIKIGSNVKLCDFGTATEERSEMTNGCGTTAYMAPEVFEGRKYDSRCDVYSFGIFLYELFERRRAYADEGWNSYQIMWKVSQNYRPHFWRFFDENEEDDMQKHPDLVDGETQILRLIKMCWKRNPEYRPSMTTVLEKLRGISKSDNRFCNRMY